MGIKSNINLCCREFVATARARVPTLHTEVPKDPHPLKTPRNLPLVQIPPQFQRTSSSAGSNPIRSDLLHNPPPLLCACVSTSCSIPSSIVPCTVKMIPTTSVASHRSVVLVGLACTTLLLAVLSPSSTEAFAPSAHRYSANQAVPYSGSLVLPRARGLAMGNPQNSALHMQTPWSKAGANKRKPRPTMVSPIQMSDAAIESNDDESDSKKKGFLQKIKSIVPPQEERQKLVPLALMFFCILFNYTILRDTKDVLMVTAPKSGAEVIPFIKTYCNLPVAIVSTFW